MTHTCSPARITEKHTGKDTLKDTYKDTHLQPHENHRQILGCRQTGDGGAGEGKVFKEVLG